MALKYLRYVRFLIGSIILLCVFNAKTQAEERQSILVLSPYHKLFNQAYLGIKTELDESLVVDTFYITPKTTPEHLNTQIAKTHPLALVLMDNRSINLYRNWTTGQKEKQQPVLPAIALMAINMDLAIADIPNIQGIAYETPMVTALMNLRSVLDIPIDKVGVICRGSFTSMVQRQTLFCAKEKIEIIPSLLDDSKSIDVRMVKKAIRKLTASSKIDALWIPNDNVILSSQLLLNAWMPLLSESRIPIVVGVETLVNPALQFGTYAVLPDPQALGEQAAHLLSQLMDNNWQFSETKVFPPISVYSVLNMEKAGRITDEKKMNLEEVTKVLRKKK